MGAIFSLVLCLSMTALAVYSLFWTKVPLLMPVATGGIAAIAGAMVVMNDWPKVWKPLLTGQTPPQ